MFVSESVVYKMFYNNITEIGLDGVQAATQISTMKIISI